MDHVAKDEKIRHSSAYKPRLYPYDGDVAPLDIDRCQGVRASWTRPNDPLYEHGRKLEMARDWKIPDVTVSVTQLEYGEMDFWRKLANKTDAVTKIELSDFDDSKVDLVTVEDEKHGGSLIMCKHRPRLSVAGITINVPDPDSRLERIVDLAGDKNLTWRENNKCFIYKKFTYTSPGDEVLDCSDPTPVKNPDNNAEIWRVLRVRGTATTKLELDDDYSVNSGADSVTISSPQSGDIYKVYYTASTWGTAGKPTAQNDSDDYQITPEQCDFLLVDTRSGGTEHKVHKLTSASMAATFARRMEGELGSDEKVLRDVSSRAVTVSLGSFVTDGSFDELMRGKAGNDYGLIDVEKFIETIKFVVKIYTDKNKTTFKMGYMVENLKYPSGGGDAPVNDLLSKDVTLEADNLTISSVEGDL